MDFSYYIMDEEVYADMKMTFQPKKRQRAKVHGFRARMSSAGGRKALRCTLGAGELVILMKRFNSIKKNSEFQKVYKIGKSYANKLLVMYVKRVDDGKEPRIGISVSKKVGNSVVRHHVTRLVRESYRLNKDRVRLGLDIVVVARPAAKEADFKKIESAYLHLCGLHNILENRSENID